MYRVARHLRTLQSPTRFVGVLVCIAAIAQSARSIEQPATANPHWKLDACNACHEMSSGKATPIALEKIDTLCLSCHDGKKAAAEVHPIRRKFKPAEKLIRPDNWPAIDDQIGCITCHDSQFACDPKTNAPAGNHLFLRGRGDAAARQQSFCQNCHQEESYRKINPHLMVASDDQIIEDRCGVCHAKTPDRKTVHRSSDPGLKGEQAAICRDCHGRHKDPITQEHIGRKVKAEQRSYMAAKDVLGLSSNPSKELIQQFGAAGVAPKLVVPAKDGSILCSTCHNPHQRGVFSEESDLAYGTMRFDRRDRLVSPVREPVWCRHCHAM